MNVIDGCYQDVMQVCRNGHVITDRLRSSPERSMGHCDLCGSDTLDRCPTCGRELTVTHVSGLVAVGGGRPPACCSFCGAAFPWTKPVGPSTCESLTVLEPLLRRLPLAVRQLRTRYQDRRPFRVEDGYDLEDLLRAILPLHFDDIRLESRTPAYSSGTRTDFLLMPEKVATVAKCVTSAIDRQHLAEQWQEDVAYYSRPHRCEILVGFVYDPEARLCDPRQLETAWTRLSESLDVRCVIAS